MVLSLNGFSQNKSIIVDTIANSDYLQKESNPEIYINTNEGDTSYGIVEDIATFQGGDVRYFKNYIEKNLIYPDSAKKNSIEGKVIIQFSVNYNGFVVDAKVVRGDNLEFDKEALRCVNNSPKWKPAKQNGKIVKQLFVIPINFRIK